MTKPEFWTFEGSVWAAAPELALVELGYTDQIEKKRINVLDGENLNVWYVQKTGGTGTVPFIDDNGKHYASTKTVIQYLISNAPSGATYGTKTDESIIDAVHDEEKVDVNPNFFLISARSAEELSAKSGNVPGYFVRKHKEVLGVVSKEAPADLLESFYQKKIAGNGFLATVYSDSAPAELTQVFFGKSQQLWNNIGDLIYTTLPSALPANTPFIGGEAPGEADFHVAAWIARIGGVLGFGAGAGEWKKLSVLKDGQEVPARVGQYWDAWAGRKSWQSVYAAGLH